MRKRIITIIIMRRGRGMRRRGSRQDVHPMRHTHQKKKKNIYIYIHNISFNTVNF